MRLAVVEVVPLVGEQHAVLLGLAQFICETAADMLVVVRIAEGQCWHFDEFSAEQAQHVLLFLALRFRNHDDGAIAARGGDQRKADAGVAGGAFDNEATGLEIAALLRLKDHLLAGAVLHRLARIHELGLAENGATGDFRGAFQFDERRVADGFDDVITNGHEIERPGIGCDRRRRAR
jgi:hypothetical protein